MAAAAGDCQSNLLPAVSRHFQYPAGQQDNKSLALNVHAEVADVIGRRAWFTSQFKTNGICEGVTKFRNFRYI